MTANDLCRDEELSSLLPSPTATELTILRESLRSEGLLSPLLVWPAPDGRLVLLDGFARLKLALEVGVAIRWTEVPLPDRDAAIEFRLRQQLARRSLPAIAQSYLRGRLYLLAGKRQGARTDLPKGKADAQMTARGVAERFGLSERTIRRDQCLAKAVDRLGTKEHLGPEFKAELLAGRSRLPRREVFRLLQLKQAERERRLAQLRAEEEVRRTRPRRKPAATPKAADSTGNSGADTPVVARKEVVPVASQSSPPVEPPMSRERLTVAARQAASDAAVAFCLASPATIGGVADPDPVDETVLKQLSVLWREASHSTRRAFLDQPSVQVAIGGSRGTACARRP